MILLGDGGEEAFGFHLCEDLCNILLQLVAADHDDFEAILLAVAVVLAVPDGRERASEDVLYHEILPSGSDRCHSLIALRAERAD